MSNHIISEVYKRQIGSIARTAIMILMADKASDDGSGIWASKQRMADEIGASKQTVITTVKALMDDDLIAEVGQRRCANGFTVEYAINLKALYDLPFVSCHQSKSLTGQNGIPHQSKSLTPPVKELDPNPHRTPIQPPCIIQRPEGVSPEVWRDVLKNRKRPLTETALSSIEKEAGKAGWTLEAVFIECCARGWQGFKAEWVKDKTYGRQSNGNHKKDGAAAALDRRLGLEQPSRPSGRRDLIEGEGDRGSLPAPSGTLW